jgi:anthranilate phosphoribosyltransferase
VLGNLGVKHALVVHGLDGVDEISISGPSVISEMEDGLVHTYRVIPEDLGIARAPREYIRGGTKEENAAITEAILKGEQGPRRDVVLLNASAALLAAGAVRSLKEGVAAAEQSIDSGAAYGALESLRRLTRQLAAVAS